MASIKKRPSGVWRARYRDHDGKEYSRHFKYQNNPRDPGNSAQHWLDSQTASLVTGTHVDPRQSKTTLASFYPDWADRQIWAFSTRGAMDLAVNKCTFRDVEFGRLKRSHAEAWVKAMEKTLAASTIRTRVRNVRTVLHGAVRDKALVGDPLDGVVLPRLRRAEHAMVIPTPEEVGRILDAADGWFETYLNACAFAGTRQGEGSGLQLPDIDFLNRTVHIQRQVIRSTGPIAQATEPKHGSERVVPVADELLNRFALHVQKYGTVGEEQWLFRGSGHQPPKHGRIDDMWRATVKVAECEHLTLHSFRHFFASGLIADGCDVVTVQKAMGHSKASITLDTYSHLWPKADDRTRAAGARLIEATSAKTPADRLRTALR
ncbi:tyrosine-type recombinase/integrase [Herbiconiux sp. P17]|uniref:tyrosine-type recombinase/integrase n=1 Tax=Herbiconiux wuyangfengii TaxID=3342794 RepID=UPI0035B99F23